MEEYALRKFLTRYSSFKLFLKEIANEGYEQKFSTPKHVLEWADILQKNKKVAFMSARLHLKSTTIYHYIAWLMLMNMDKDMEILYVSYKQESAEYHLRKIKRYISMHPLFKDFKDLTPAESKLKYTFDGVHKFIVEPEGILSFKRGRHCAVVIADDILADPSQELNFQVIDKITRQFDEDLINIPTLDGQLILIGTPAHQEDLFFKIKERYQNKTTDFVYKEYPAIVDETKKQSLWPEQFPFELLEKKRLESERSFSKEFMCSPVWSEEAFFKRIEVDRVSVLLEEKLPKGVESWNSEVWAALDIGKVRHPSHLSIFTFDEKGILIQLYQKFMDEWDYVKQIDFIKGLQEPFKIKKIYYDATRAEFEGFLETGYIDRQTWRPIIFKASGDGSKWEMANNFRRLVEQDRIRLIKNNRQIKSILSVNNELNAAETDIGHGDAFWSIAMALTHKKSMPPLFIAGRIPSE